MIRYADGEIEAGEYSGGEAVGGGMRWSADGQTVNRHATPT